MDLNEGLEKLNQYFVKAQGRGMTRDAFEIAAAIHIDEYFEGLGESDADALRQQLSSLSDALPIVLATSRDFADAAQICRSAARQWRTSSWYNDVIELWPAPISHEVRRLVALLDGENRPPSPEGALLQVRDLSETLLKLPTVILARYLMDQGGDDSEAIRRRINVVSGGDWNSLARDASERLQKRDTPEYVARLSQLFQKASPYRLAVDGMAAARNTYIGHGALPSNPMETARLVSSFMSRDTSERASAGLQSPTIGEALAFAATMNLWQGVLLECETETETIELMGSAALDRWLEDSRHKAEHHQGKNLPVRLTLLDDGKALELGPLIAARLCLECGHRDVFFFDHVYKRSPLRVDFIDYGRGHKTRLDGNLEASDMRVAIEMTATENSVAAYGTGLLDKGTAIAALDRMRIDERYRSPKYLRTPLAVFLRHHQSGIYWLQAPAHVGKTMLIQGLAEPFLNDEAIVNGLKPGVGGGTAVYYCKHEYRSGQIAFLNGLAESIKDALDLRRDSRFIFPDARDVITAEDQRAAFASWLQAWQTLDGGTPRRLLIAIDGLDESDDPATGDSLLSILPRSSQLSSGLSLVLTSRRVGDAECPTWLGPAMTAVMDDEDHTAKRILDLEDAGYQSLLGDYVRAGLGLANGAESASIVESLIAQAEERFVFLSFLVEQLRGGRAPADAIGELGKGQEIYDRFIDGLETRYGAKRADDLLAILGCLTAAQEAHDWILGAGAVDDPATGRTLAPIARDWAGLSIELLARITHMDEPPVGGRATLRVSFIEALILIQGVLTVWRGERGGARYRLGLKDFSTSMRFRRPHEVQRAHAWIANTALDAVEAMAAVSPDERDSIESKTVYDLLPLVSASQSLANVDSVRERFFRLPLLDVSLTLENIVGSKAELVTLYDNILVAMAYGAGPPSDDGQRRREADTYFSRSAAKRDAVGFGIADVLFDQNRAIEMYEYLCVRYGPDCPASLRLELAKSYGNRAVAGVDLLGQIASLTDTDRAIEIMESIREEYGAEWPAEWCQDLAMGYLNRGIAKTHLTTFGTDAAVADYDRALDLMQSFRDMQQGWSTDWRETTALIYSARGRVQSPCRSASERFLDLDRAIAIREALRDECGDAWPDRWCNELARTYLSRAEARLDSPYHGLNVALLDYDRAIELREQLRLSLGPAWPETWCDDLATAYMLRGSAHLSVASQNRTDALADYDKAIELVKSLQDEDDRSAFRGFTLAGIYMNRGAAKSAMPGHGPLEALKDYDRSITLMNELRAVRGSKWPSKWRYELSRALENRAQTRLDLPDQEVSSALLDFDEAIALMEHVHDDRDSEFTEDWRPALAKVYCNRAVTRASRLGDGASAMLDLSHAIDVLGELCKELDPGRSSEHQHSLALAYLAQAGIKQASGYDRSSCLIDCDRCINLLETLRDKSWASWNADMNEQLSAAYDLRKSLLGWRSFLSRFRSHGWKSNRRGTGDHNFNDNS
jgi:hypothetical protein